MLLKYVLSAILVDIDLHNHINYTVYWHTYYKLAICSSSLSTSIGVIKCLAQCQKNNHENVIDWSATLILLTFSYQNTHSRDCYGVFWSDLHFDS